MLVSLGSDPLTGDRDPQGLRQRDIDTADADEVHWVPLADGTRIGIRGTKDKSVQTLRPPWIETDRIRF